MSFEENKDRWIIHERVAWVSSAQTSCNMYEHLVLRAGVLDTPKLECSSDQSPGIKCLARHTKRKRKVFRCHISHRFSKESQGHPHHSE